MIERTPYIESPRPGMAVSMASTGYSDGALTREETLSSTARSDDYRSWRRRLSSDNGHSWSEETEIPDVVRDDERGGIVSFPGAPIWDRDGGRLFRISMTRIWPGNPAYTFNWVNHHHPFHDHVFASIDGADPTCLRFEDGPDYDPDCPFDPEFARTNRAYHGQGLSFLPDGTALHPMVCYPPEIPSPHCLGGVVLMRLAPGESRWTASNRIYVSPETSSRGLLEPDAVHLKDGRILIVCRGSDTPQTPGRKWMTWSEDGGRTLAPAREFEYADGSRFYSPSSFHQFYRASRTGVLYWIGNICPHPPNANAPRFPLMIGVINEDTMGLERDSLEIIDDRQPGEPESIYFSNFRMVENRETLDLEIFMSRGAAWEEKNWNHTIYRYVFKP